jgi:HlyD family secretion protein
MNARWLPWAALAALALAGCVNRAQQAQAKRTAELVSDPTVPVQVALAIQGDMDETVVVTGSIRAADESGVGAQAGGRLVAVYVRDGDSVGAGQAIAQIEGAEAAARLRQALAQSDEARARLRQAVNDASASPQRTAAAIRAAEARLAQARARLELAAKGARDEERIQAEWGVRRAKSDLDTADRERARARRLAEEGVIPKVEVERAENAYDNALAAYNSAVQTLATVQNATRPEELQSAREEVRAAEASLQAEQANRFADKAAEDRVGQARAGLRAAEEQVALARKSVSDTTVRAPFGGKVSGRPLQPGTYVAPGTVVARIVGTGALYFEGQVPSSRVSRVALGSRVLVTTEGTGRASFEGTVAAMDPSAAGIGRVYTVRVSLGDGSGQLKDGMFAKGEVTVGRRAGVTIVPEAAVVRDGEQASVFVVAEGKAKRVSVKPGLSREGRTEVGGLEPGAQVVTVGQTTIVDGSPVRIVDPKAEGKG